MTKFDETGIAGTFRASVQIGTPAENKKAVVEGTFEFPCASGGRCRG